MYINDRKNYYHNRYHNKTYYRDAVQGVREMPVSNVTQGINADILTNMKSSKNVLSKVDEDRKDAVEKSKVYFKEVLQTSTDIKDNVAKGINVDVTT